MFTCPICSALLIKSGNCFRCISNHCYDISAEGYIHLLPANKMHSHVPGDTKEMVASRRSFLEKGFYSLFREKAVSVAAVYTSTDSVYLDAGCGEGYYTREIGKNCVSFGFDISKYAVRSASKKDSHTLYAVAGSYDIPFENGGADFLSCIFSPIVPSEFARVIKKSGIFMAAVPSKRHLYGLKQAIYDQPYENEYTETEYAGFRFISRHSARDEINITDGKTIRELFAMTPYFWKSTKQSSERAASLNELRTEIGFDFLIYEKL